MNFIRTEAGWLNIYHEIFLVSQNTISQAGSRDPRATKSILRARLCSPLCILSGIVIRRTRSTKIIRSRLWVLVPLHPTCTFFRTPFNLQALRICSLRLYTHSEACSFERHFSPSSLAIFNRIGALPKVLRGFLDSEWRWSGEYKFKPEFL